MIDLTDCKNLNDVARKEFGKVNYYNRERVKKLLSENGIDWKEWKAQKKADKNEIRYCKFCGKEITGYNKIFCNSSCAAKFNNTHRVLKRNSDIKDNLVEFNNKIHIKNYCKCCGKELKSHQQNFCSTNCQQKYYYEEYIKRWQNGEENGMKGQYGLSKRIRRYLLEKHEHKCELCGWGEVNPYTGTIPLEIHHIDGDYTNNSESNLQVLCPNCHSLTETHKSHNKSGRKGRKKYYLKEEFQ